APTDIACASAARHRRGGQGQSRPERVRGLHSEPRGHRQTHRQGREDVQAEHHGGHHEAGRPRQQLSLHHSALRPRGLPQPRRAGHAASAAPARASWAPAAATARGDTQSSRVPYANNNTRRRRHCGDLQNEQPNPALNARDRKMCYYFEPIRAAIAQPFSTRMPKDRVCKRLKQSNGEICNVKYQVQVDNNLSDEEMLAQLKKKRVKELKGILNDRGVKCEGCLEKDDFIKKIMATNGMSTDF
ncbi:unnamed protein product, partial [Pelagomonas calceolata]